MDFGFPLDPGEKITRVVHRHAAALIAPIGFALILAATAAALAYLAGRFPDSLPFPMMLVFALIIVFAVLAVIVFLIAVFVYAHNFLVFTTARFIEVEQLGLFNRRVAQLNYRHVQDATGHRVGIAGTIFNYGDVQIQSAAEQEQFIFHYAPNPVQLADDAVEAHEQCMREQAAAPAPAGPQNSGV